MLRPRGLGVRARAGPWEADRGSAPGPQSSHASGTACTPPVGDITLGVVISPAVSARSAPIASRVGASMPRAPSVVAGAVGLRGARAGGSLELCGPDWPRLVGAGAVDRPGLVGATPAGAAVVLGSPFDGAFAAGVVAGRSAAGAHVHVQCHCQAPPRDLGDDRAECGEPAAVRGSAVELPLPRPDPRLRCRVLADRRAGDRDGRREVRRRLLCRRGARRRHLRRRAGCGAAAGRSARPPARRSSPPPAHRRR